MVTCTGRGWIAEMPQVYPKGTHFLLTRRMQRMPSRPFLLSEQVFLLTALRSLDSLSIPTVSFFSFQTWKAFTLNLLTPTLWKCVNHYGPATKQLSSSWCSLFFSPVAQKNAAYTIVQNSKLNPIQSFIQSKPACPFLFIFIFVSRKFIDCEHLPQFDRVVSDLWWVKPSVTAPD